MTNEDELDLDRVRGRALDRIDRARRCFWWLVAGTALIEGACLVTYLLLMDWGDRMHQLLLVASLLIYWTLAGCVMALGAYGNLVAQRLLKSVELLEASFRKD